MCLTSCAFQSDEDIEQKATPQKKNKKEKKESKDDSKEKKEKLSGADSLRKRYAKLIKRIDVAKDEKLNSKKAAVDVERMRKVVIAELEKYGEVYVKDFPELCKGKKAVKGKKGGARYEEIMFFLQDPN